MKNKFFFSILILLLAISFQSFANVLSSIDTQKIKSIGFSYSQNSNESFAIFQKTREGKNSKVIAFWENQQLNVQTISDALVLENTKYFDKVNSLVHDNAMITKYLGKTDKAIHFYDIVFQSKKNPQIFVSVNFSGKATLTKNEFSALINEAESFIK